MKAYLKAMRPGRWPRSLAVYVGSAVYYLLHWDPAGSMDMVNILLRALVIFLLTWAVSTANYIINEIVDAPFDVHHPVKKNRPLIRGEIKKTPFMFWGIILTVTSLAAAFVFFNRSFFFSLAALLLAGFIYNLPPVRTKDIPFLDSISESANNPIRFLIGWFAFAPAGEFPPLSLLISWWAFGNFLMVAKRFSEFRFLKSKAGDYRSSLKKYSTLSLFTGMIFSSVVFFLAYFLFALNFEIQSFLYLSPLLVIYFGLFFKKTFQKKEVLDEPEQLLRQPLFALFTLVLLLVYLAAFFYEKTG
ncbi:MAG: UbiA family prenyltransferase [Candidatus Aminicenantes bacterium]